MGIVLSVELTVFGLRFAQRVVCLIAPPPELQLRLPLRLWWVLPLPLIQRRPFSSSSSSSFWLFVCFCGIFISNEPALSVPLGVDCGVGLMQNSNEKRCKWEKEEAAKWELGGAREKEEVSLRQNGFRHESGSQNTERGPLTWLRLFMFSAVPSHPCSPFFAANLLPDWKGFLI